MMNEICVNDENPEVQNINHLGGSVLLEVEQTKILPPVLDFDTFPANNTASVSHNHAAMLALPSFEQEKAITTQSHCQNVEDKCGVGSTVKKSGSMQDVASGFKLADGNVKVPDSISSICRTQSYHSIVQALPRSDGVEIRAGVRKAASSHAVQGIQLGARSSAPVITTVAFNAELLAAFERERRMLDRRISELTQIAEFRRLEIERLRIELRQRDEHDIADEDPELSSHQKCQSQELPGNLSINVEHFTDSEKLSLLQVGRLSGDRNSCSLDSQKFRVVSDGGESYSRETDYELALSATSMDANWDYASEGAATTGSGSEVSMACLQDRLLAMEETQYSTNEELAATLQELGDLQDTVNLLTSENEQLADERAILLESLCTQTQKLENSRRQVENLKALVFRDCDGMEVRSEKETQLVALLHCAEEEREELRLKQTELSNTVSGLSAEKQALQHMISMLSNQTNGLESQLCALIADKKVLEANLAAMKVGGHIDCNLTQSSPFLTDELKPAKPVDSPEKECQQCLCFEHLLGTVRSELASVYDEKNALVEKIQQLEQESNEQRILIMEYENDLKAAAHKLETAELESVEAHNALRKLHVSNAQIAEEQKAVIRRLEAELQLANTRASEAVQQIAEITLRHDLESAEWINFQRDLQTAVRVAVEVRNESQEQVEILQAEKRALIEKEMLLNHEIDSMRAELSRLRAVQPSIVETKSTIRDCVMNTVDRELTLLRQQGRRVSDGTVGPCDNVESMQTGSKPSLSVRHLIASIEEQLKADNSSSYSGRFDLHQTKLGNIVQTSGESVLKCASKPLSLSLSPVLNRSLCVSSAHEMNSDSSVFNDPQIMDGMLMAATDETKCAVAELTIGTLPTVDKICRDDAVLGQRKPVSGILANKSQKKKICSSIIDSDSIDNKVGGLSTVMANHSLSKTVTADPLSALAKQLGGSKRNALLKWCQNRTATYTGIDVTNFSSSWNDGLAFCALLHTYLPHQIPYKDLTSEDKKYNFTLAFKAAESVGISTTLNMNDMLATERPDWQAVMTYITSIYRHFEIECRS